MRDTQTHPALRALVRLEIVRTLPVLGRAVAFGGVVTLALVVTGAFTLPRLAFILAVVGSGTVLAVGVNALRDKVEGGLGFLQLLPASPGTQARARFLAVFLFAVPGAFLGTAAAALALHGEFPGLARPGSLVGIFVALALTFVVGGTWLTALVLRFDLSQTTYAPLLVMAGVVALDHFEERFIPDPLASLQGLFLHRWFLPAAWGAAIALAALALWGAYALARAGIARYAPPGDRIVW